MFVLKIIDSENKEYEVFKTKSQIDMDRFTTFYDSEDDLIEDLFFEKGSKVNIVQTGLKDKESTILPFTSSEYRNLVYSFNNKDYFNKVVGYNPRLIKSFFQNEVLKFDYNRSKFEKDKYISCKAVLGDFRMSDESYFKDVLKKELYSFFQNFYSSFKDFYKYITNFYQEEEHIFTEEEIKEHERLVDSIKNKVHGEVEEIETLLPYEDETHSISSNPLADIDDKYTDLDIYLDSNNVDEETKNKIISKQIKKL